MTIEHFAPTETTVDEQASQPSPSSPRALGAMGLAAAALSACGGGSDPSSSPDATLREQPQAITIGATTKPAAADPITKVSADAWRFLTQATFGPTPSDLAATSTLMSKGYQSWLNEQFARQQPITTFELAKLNNGKWGPNGGGVFNMGPDVVCSALWEQFIAGPDQLRQRVAFALSEILVVSFRGGDLGEKALAVASFHDTLVKNAFGSFRTLVEEVAKHPAMGCYLTHLRNEKPDTSIGRIPDQNFARELMQLFTIGLVQLNMDGTPVLDTSNKPIPTYNRFDISVLSHVFTGWAWSSGNWNEGIDVRNSVPAKWDLMRTPMAPLNTFHATPSDFSKIYQSGATPLLFTATAFTPSGDTQTDLTRALDLLFKHPNIAPFIARQMIQRLVTSNPTAAYVKRVALAFKNSNFSLKSLVQAVLLDSDARDLTAVQASNTFGKLREPVLRVTAALRAMGYSTLTVKVDGVTQPRPIFSLPLTFNTQGGVPTSLGQGPYQAASVFNFYRPDHVATWSESGKLGLKAPELQATSELDVAAYIRFVVSGLGWGIGSDVQLTTPATNVPRTPYIEDTAIKLVDARSIQMTYKEEVTLGMASLKTLTATDGLDKVRTLVLNSIVTPINRKLLGGQMSAALQNTLMDTIAPRVNTQRDIWGVLLAARDALTMTMISAEYVVQK